MRCSCKVLDCALNVLVAASTISIHGASVVHAVQAARIRRLQCMHKQRL